MTLSTIRAAIARLFHRSPTDQTMANNTALADATRKLTDATTALTAERQHTATQAQQLVTLQGQYDSEHTARLAAEQVAADEKARADALQEQLDALPDAAAVDAAVQAEIAAADVIGAGSPDAQAATASTPATSA